MKTTPIDYYGPWTRSGLDVVGRRNESGLPRQIARAADEATADLIAASLAMRVALEAILAECGEDYDERDPFETIREYAAKALKAARDGNYA